MVNWLNEIGKEHAGALGVISIAVALITAIPTLFLAYRALQKPGHNSLARLQDHRTWPKLMGSLNANYAQAYLGAVTRTAEWFSSIYGKNLWGWQAFDRTLDIALMYSISTLLVGWLLFGVGNLGGATFLPEGLPFVTRFLMVLVIAACTYLVFLSLQSESAILKFWQKRLGDRARNIGKKSKWVYALLPSLLTLLTQLCAVAVAVAGAGVVAGVFAAAVAVAGVVAGVVVVAGAGVVVVAGAGVVFVAVVVVVVANVPFFGAIANPPPPAFTSFVLFFIVLPILNACADYVSIAATRLFLNRISNHAGIAAVAFGIALDLLIAAICLAGLLFTILLVLELWAGFAPRTLNLDWRDYLAEVCTGEWQRGTMVYLMLVTTLAPTVIHLAAGLCSMLLRNSYVDLKIKFLLQPAYDRLIKNHGNDVFDQYNSTHADSELDRDTQTTIDKLLAKRTWYSTIVFAVLFCLFWALLVGIVWNAAPWVGAQVCPA